MKLKIFSFGILLVIPVLCIISCHNAGLWLVKKDEPVKADAIIILMGSIADRALEAADLYVEGLARIVIIAEESMGAYKVLEARGGKISSNSKQIRNVLVALGIPDDSIIILPGDAESTQMEAIIIKDYIKCESEIDTINLVSSSFHTRRAFMIFETAFKEEELPIEILCSPSKYSNFNAKRWWRDRESFQMVLTEYLKIGNFVLFEKRKLRKL